MIENVGRKVALIIALLVGSIVLLLYRPLVHDKPPFPLGLDIAGGERLLYKVDIAEARRSGSIPASVPDSQVMSEVIDVFRKRCDMSGNTEAVIRAVGRDRIEVAIPEVSAGGVTASTQLSVDVPAEGLPRVVLHRDPPPVQEAGKPPVQPPRQAYENFPGSGGTIRIGDERMVYSSRIGNELLIKERGTERTSIAAHPAGANVTFIGGDEVKNALENLGDMKFMAVAEDEDLRAAGSDGTAAAQLVTTWQQKPENAGAPIRLFNALPPEQGGPPRGTQWFPHRLDEGAEMPATRPGLFVLIPTENETFTGGDLSNVGPTNDRFGYPAINFSMNESDGTAFRFGQFTRKLVKKRLAIVMNDEIVTAPTIDEALFGNSIIQGRFSQAECTSMVTVLRSGSLKIRPELEFSETVGASIGDDYVRKNVWAGVVTLSVIVGFMLIYYGRLGLWGSLTLVLNLLFTMSGMVIIQGTLTLAGIAGVVLTIGQAVDASILIFERIRDEQEKGRKPLHAAKEGFAHAMSAIVDGNLTALIVGIVLLWQGTGTIRGFALTLVLGIITTLICTMLVLRVLIHFELKLGVERFKMRQFFARTNFKFMAKRKLAIGLSTLVMALGVVWFMAQDDRQKLGIDFLGGATVKVRTEEPISVGDLRERVAKLPGEIASAEVVDLPGSREADGRARVFRITFKSQAGADPDSSTAAARTFKQEIEAGLADILQQGEVVCSTVVDGAITRASATLYFEEDHEIAEVEKLLGPAGVSEAKVAYRGERRDTFTVEGVTATGMDAATLKDNLTGAFAGKTDAMGHDFKLALPIPETSIVGAQVVGELRDSAIKALALASLLILLYIRVRFAEYSYGWGALLADLHDTLTTFAAIAFMVWTKWIRVELDLTMIAAFLTILGYSLNDTIVAFDRIRENLPRVKGSLDEICDLSINQTLSRTIITSGTTIVASGIILAFNFHTGNALESFAYVLSFGVVTGTYSSIFVASPIFVWLEERSRRKGQAGGGVSSTPSKPPPAPAPVEGTV
jgi:SecD/SecF fusion protein